LRIVPGDPLAIGYRDQIEREKQRKKEQELIQKIIQ
jgi:hypothetical protein